MEIKPCPFCGSESVYIRQRHVRIRNYWMVFVQCDFCKAQGRIFESGRKPASESNWENEACENAVRAWNMRAEIK